MSENTAEPNEKFTKKSVFGIVALLGALLFVVGYVVPRMQESASLKAVGEIERAVRALKNRIDAEYATRGFSEVSTENVRAFAVKETALKDGGPIRLSDLTRLEVFPLENGEGYFFVLEGVRKVACEGLYEKFRDANVMVNGRSVREGCNDRRMGNNMRIEFTPKDATQA